MSLQSSDAEAAVHAVAPRVMLADIEGAIVARHYLSGVTAASCADHSDEPSEMDDRTLESLKVLTICLVVVKNGFTIIGKSAPASPDNFNAAFGRKLAYEDAIRQLWPLMGYALREKLASS